MFIYFNAQSLHHMGSTHDDLKSRVKKHYKEVWKMVQNEYVEEGLCEDVSKNIGRPSTFGSSMRMAHFAKHCRNFATADEVSRWCEKNMKVEKCELDFCTSSCQYIQEHPPNVLLHKTIISF